MYEEFKYVNHLGEEINFGREGMYVNASDLHDYNWTVASINGKISGFSRGMQNRSLPVRIACVSESDGIMKRNRLFELPEKDVIGEEYGRLVINGYHCDCFITASKKARYNVSDRYMAVTLTITTDRPVWVKETLVQVNADPGWESGIVGGVDFPFDFPFDYVGTIDRHTHRANTAYADSNFRMVIHGVCSNPTVYVNGHEYQVNVDVGLNEMLTVDSSIQKIYVTDRNGDTVNAFDKRNRDSYIFQKIPPGTLDIKWNNQFTIDLYLLEERSEPRWRMGEKV